MFGVSAKKLAQWTAVLALTVAAAVWLLSKKTAGFGHFGELCLAALAPRWPVLLAATAAFWLLDYMRFYTLLTLFGIRLKPGPGFRMSCVSYFVSSLTPSAELHVPAMAYLMSKEGVPSPIAAGVSLTKSLYVTLWICIIAAVSAGLEPGLSFPVAVTPGRYATVILVLTVPLALLVLFSGSAHAWAQARMARPGMRPWAAKALGWLDHAAGAMARIGGSTEPGHLLCHGASIVFVLVYAFIGWQLAGAAGFSLPYKRAVAVFANGLMVAYLAPVPGSVGVTEWFTASLLDASLSEEAIAVAFVLRCLCWYGAMPLGALFTVLAARAAPPEFTTRSESALT